MAGTVKKRWSELLRASIETWAHQILFQRHVFPRLSFAPVRFLGVKCQANRHPDVVVYISESVTIAVDAILAGTTDRIELTIIDERSGTERELERYSLDVNAEDMLNPLWDEEAVDAVIEGLERTMRDLILKVYSLDTKRISSSETLSFRMTLSLTQQEQQCQRLNQAIATGNFIVNERSADPVRECFLWDNTVPELCQLRFSCSNLSQKHG